jgi:hypothetical protein
VQGLVLGVQDLVLGLLLKNELHGLFDVHQAASL